MPAGKRIICLMLFCWLTKMAVATIAINIYQDTTFGMEDHLTIAYAAAANYNTFPNYLWNSHVFTLRWPDSLGSNVICGMTDIHGFLYATDPGLMGSPYACGGYYYQKIITQALAKQFSITSGQSIEMLKIQICLPMNMTCGFFELADCPDTCVANNFGCAAINNAVLGDQFCCVGTGAAACLPLAIPETKLTAMPVSKSFVRLTAHNLQAESWETLILERSTDGFLFNRIHSWNYSTSEAPNQLIFDDQGALTSKKYFYRLRLLMDDIETFQTSPIQVHILATEQHFRVFPTPTQGTLYLEGWLPKAGSIQAELINGQGQSVLSQKMDASSGLFHRAIELSALPKGNYYLRLIGGQGVLLEKKVIYY
jgi:hypothetical protein